MSDAGIRPRNTWTGAQVDPVCKMVSRHSEQRVGDLRTSYPIKSTFGTLCDSTKWSQCHLSGFDNNSELRRQCLSGAVMENHQIWEGLFWWLSSSDWWCQRVDQVVYRPLQFREHPTPVLAMNLQIRFTLIYCRQLCWIMTLPVFTY